MPPSLRDDLANVENFTCFDFVDGGDSYSVSLQSQPAALASRSVARWSLP
jgi:hypothetical protein